MRDLLYCTVVKLILLRSLTKFLAKAAQYFISHPRITSLLNSEGSHIKVAYRCNTVEMYWITHTFNEKLIVCKSVAAKDYKLHDRPAPLESLVRRKLAVVCTCLIFTSDFVTLSSSSSIWHDVQFASNWMTALCHHSSDWDHWLKIKAYAWKQLQSFLLTDK